MIVASSQSTPVLVASQAGLPAETVPRLERKHVLFLIENASVPLDRRVWKEAVTVLDMGHEVSIVCPRGSKVDVESRVRLNDIPIYRYSPIVVGAGIVSYLIEYLNALVRSAWLIFSINRNLKIDIFHVGNPPDIFFLIIFWYRLLGARYVFDIHDLFANMFESKFQAKHLTIIRKPAVALLRLVERLNIACADFVVVTNNSYRQYVEETHRLPKSRSAVVRNAPPLDDRNAISPDPSLKKGKKYLIAYFGVMGEDDGVDVVLRAVHHLVNVKRFADFHCVLIGPTDVSLSPAILSLQRLHRELGLEDYVEFSGFLPWPQVHRYLKTADLGLSPDPFTTQNDLSTMIKMMEYMSHGLPIISFSLKENRISAGDAAVYCETFDFREFADKIQESLGDEPLRIRMSRSGLTRHINEFNWGVSSSALQKIYRSLQSET